MSIPVVQRNLGQRTTNFLNKKFEVSIEIGQIDLSYLGDVHMDEVLIQDHHGDTLIYVQELVSSLNNYRKIFNNKLEFDHISLENFILNIKTYKDENNDALSVFVEKLGSGKKANKRSKFLLTSDKIQLKNGIVELIDENMQQDNPLYFKEISGDTRDFKIEGPNVYIFVEELSFIDNHRVEVEKLSTEFTYTKSFMKFLNMQLETKTSKVLANVEFDYDRENLRDFKNKVNISARVEEAALSLIDLQKFYGEFGNDDVMRFSVNITGQLNNLVLHDLKLNSDNEVVIDGDVNLKNSFNRENGFSMDGDFTNLIAGFNQLKGLLPNIFGESFPTILSKLGKISTTGKTRITQNLIQTDVKSMTDLGIIEANLELRDIHSIDEAVYIGKIGLIDFEFGEFVGDSLIGQLSLEADVEGSGFTFEKLNTTVKGIVSKHQYKNYTYSNILINGIVKNKRFNGEMEVNDENLKLNFNGLADLSSDIYRFDFNTVIDYCDLFKLNLFSRDTISSIKGEIDINMEGNSWDDLSGSVKFKNSFYSNQYDNYFFKDFNITSSFVDTIRTININSSEIIEGKVKGTFRFKELGKLAQNSIGSIYSNYTPYEVSSHQNLNFEFEIYNKIVDVFFPEIKLSKNTIINGNIDSDNELFRLNIQSPKIMAYEGVIDSLNLQIDNKSPLFNTQLMISNIASKYYNISDLHLLNKTINDTLYFGAQFGGGKNNTEDFNLFFYHTFNEDNESVVGIQRSSFTHNNNEWIINPDNNFENKVSFDKTLRTYEFSPFLMISGLQEIEFSGNIEEAVSKDLNFSFKDVELIGITPNIDSLKLEGVINGALNYREFEQFVEPIANISISDFKINNFKLGNFNFVFEGENSVRKYHLDISLERGGTKSFSALGDLDFSGKIPTVDVLTEFAEFRLDAFSQLGEDVFNKIEGFAYGNAQLKGPIKNPEMSGEIFLDKVSMYFPYLNVNYSFEGTSVVELKGQTFDFTDVTLKDTKYKTRGNLSGTLSHKYFKEWLLDLKVQSKNLLVLDTEQEENSVYFGTGFFEGEASIKGPTDKLVIDVIGKTKRNTHFVVPLSDVKTVKPSRLIHFIETDTKQDIEEIRRAYISEKLKGMSLNFDLEVTQDAIFEMVLDQSTGSYLRGGGKGNLQIHLDTKDKFEMYGDFIVDNGVYDFKYGGFINKPFIVKKGGIISWNGDPLKADINIEAIHRVSANPRTLLENISSNRKIPVDLITRFSGDLFNSKSEFDIEFTNSSSTVASELEFKLRNNKTIQFISLLVTGSFYNETNTSSTSNTVLYGTGADILSNAFDNILNNSENKFKLKPVYTVGENNEVDNLDIDDQLALALDYQVNDRIIINGKVGVPIGSEEKANIIGEVNVDFLMNEEGTFRSSVFNRQNEIQYTEEEEGYTQGVGMTYQIDFDNGRELLEKLSLKKRVQKDSVDSKKQMDSIQKNNKLINFKNKNKKNE